jgi:peptide/nickel transport system permease protein
VSSAALVLTELAPGDVTTEESLNLDAATRARLRAELGLDRPFAVQYLSWLGGMLRFDFGRSLLYARPVADLLGERALNTAVLATTALLLATLIGIPLGLYSGSGRGVGPAAVRALSVLALSVPPLVGSLALVFLAVKTGWFPVGGMSSVGAMELSWAARVADMTRHLPVPALALAIPLAASLERLQANAIADVSRETFVAASRARGLTRLQAILRHVWPVSVKPVLGLYGVMIGTLFSGSFIVEVVTSWPGLGRLMFEALQARDLFLAAGCAATGALFLAVGTLIADVLMAVTDPRVHEDRA